MTEFIHRFLSFLALCIIGAVLTSCKTLEQRREAARERKAALELAERRAEEETNYAAFLQAPDYRKRFFANEVLMPGLNPENSAIEVSLKKQRAFVKMGDQIIIDSPVSSGKSGHRTPRGNFKITEKLKNKRSNLYGVIYDRHGKITRSDASRRKHSVPSGGKFVGASMPYWMRLTGSGIGMHAGFVPNYPASHGCIRLPHEIAPRIFEKVKVGTRVTVK